LLAGGRTSALHPEALRHRSYPLKKPVPEVKIDATVTLTHLTAEEGFAGAV
jgi:hypothetical protein